MKRKGVYLVLGITALSILLIGSYARSYYASQRSREAQVQLLEVARIFQDPTIKPHSERYRRTIAEAQRIREEYGSLPAGRMAQYYIAISEEGLGNTGKAVEELQDLIQSGDPSVRPLAQFALAALYRNHGDMPNALEAYKQIEGVFPKGEGHAGGHSGVTPNPAGQSPNYPAAGKAK